MSYTCPDCNLTDDHTPIDPRWRKLVAAVGFDTAKLSCFRCWQMAGMLIRCKEVGNGGTERTVERLHTMSPDRRAALRVHVLNALKQSQ